MTPQPPTWHGWRLVTTGNRVLRLRTCVQCGKDFGPSFDTLNRCGAGHQPDLCPNCRNGNCMRGVDKLPD